MRPAETTRTRRAGTPGPHARERSVEVVVNGTFRFRPPLRVRTCTWVMNRAAGRIGVQISSARFARDFEQDERSPRGYRTRLRISAAMSWLKRARSRLCADTRGEYVISVALSWRWTARSTSCFPVTSSRRSRHRAPRVRPAPCRTARCPRSRGTAPSRACPREIWARHHSGAWRPDWRRASERSHRGAAFSREGDLAVPDSRHRPASLPF